VKGLNDVVLGVIVFSSVAITLLALWDFRKAKAAKARRWILACDLVAAAASVIALACVIVVWS
jgi:hypothetical protein